MKAKHTPGPWRVGYLDCNKQSVVMSEHIEIATCWHHSVGSIEKEMHANAALIAAAPDLLETLQVLLSLHDACVDTADAWNASMEEARAAIAKATGDYRRLP